MNTRSSNFVLDASIALGFCLMDEADETSLNVLEKLENQHAVVPGLWSLEVANILLMAERRKRISMADMTESLALLMKLPIETDTQTSTHAFNDTLALARSEKLTLYDAAYLELALRLGLPLASKDKDLHAAAKRLGVKHFK